MICACGRLRPLATTAQGFTGYIKIRINKKGKGIYDRIMLDKANQIPFQILTHRCHTAMRPAQEATTLNIKFRLLYTRGKPMEKWIGYRQFRKM